MKKRLFLLFTVFVFISCGNKDETKYTYSIKYVVFYNNVTYDTVVATSDDEIICTSYDGTNKIYTGTNRIYIGTAPYKVLKYTKSIK